MTQPLASPPTVRLAGYPLRHTSALALAERMLRAIQQHEQMVVFFANTNFIVKCNHIRQRMEDESVLIVNDGVGLNIASWIVHRRRFVENLNGTDFVPYFISQSKSPLSLYLLGGKPDVARRAGQQLAGCPNVEIAGVRDGYAQVGDTEGAVAAINASGADVILVALGNPRQERWILDHRDRLQPNILIGVGALFDFLAGDKIRAPLVVQRLRLEWLFRLCLEPSRLIRRYTIDVFVFLFLCLWCGKGANRADRR